jgi:hypothetical protein
MSAELVLLSRIRNARSFRHSHTSCRGTQILRGAHFLRLVILNLSPRDTHLFHLVELWSRS